MKHRFHANCDGIVVHSLSTGLCNRMLALAAFAVIAAERHCPLHCYWTSDEHCPGLPEHAFCRDKLYWTPIGEEQYIDLSRSLKHPAIFPYTWTSAPPATIASWWGIPPETMRELMVPHLRKLQPATDVAARLEPFLKKLPSRRIGIHVRRTDLWARGDRDNNQRDKDLISRLAMIRPPECDGPAAWITTSDNPATLKLLLIKYGDRIIHTGVPFEYAGIRCTSVESAAFDLFALASCPRILGTRGSTFSNMAAVMGQSELEMV